MWLSWSSVFVIFSLSLAWVWCIWLGLSLCLSFWDEVTVLDQKVNVFFTLRRTLLIFFSDKFLPLFLSFWIHRWIISYFTMHYAHFFLCSLCPLNLFSSSQVLFLSFAVLNLLSKLCIKMFILVSVMVRCFCLVGWLAFFVNLMQARVIWEGKTSIKKMHPYKIGL